MYAPMLLAHIIIILIRIIGVIIVVKRSELSLLSVSMSQVSC